MKKRLHLPMCLGAPGLAASLLLVLSRLCYADYQVLWVSPDAFRLGAQATPTASPVGDFDGDGRLEIAGEGQHYDTYPPRNFAQIRDALTGELEFESPGPVNVAFAEARDLDSDGIPEVLISDTGRSFLVVKFVQASLSAPDTGTNRDHLIPLALPNPVARQTRIQFSLDNAATVDLGIFDVSGRVVRRFSMMLDAGVQEIPWDGADENGTPVASGSYFYEVVANGRRLGSQQLVVIR
jgi:hypothetical protein